MAVLTLYWGLDVTLVLLSAFLAAYLYMTRNFGYWKKKGVIEIPPLPFVGNFLQCCLLRVSPSMYLGSAYERGKGLPYLGFYIFDKPALLIRDPEIIKSVLIKDFNYFPNRYVRTQKSDGVGSANMFLMKDSEWKTVRQKTSPIFTTGKMKQMFHLIAEIGENLVAHLNTLKLEGDGEVVEVKSISASYTTDVITSCAFGLQVNSLNDPNSEFKKCGINMFGSPTYKRGTEFASFFFAPAVAKLLKLKFFSEEASDFMRNVFTRTMSMRMESNTHRNDLIDLLIQLNKSDSQTNDRNTFKFEGDNLVGQAATFFAAGFETSSSTMGFTLYELALQPDIQSKLREEITAALEEREGKITYEMVMNLSYLDMVVSETLRKYPTLPFLDRVAKRDYKVPGTELVIEEGTVVYVSLFGLHYDPEYFPEPEKYDPKRFNSENKQNRPSCVYMPFGEGPRNCIGLRFGLLQSKLGIIKIISNYEVSKCAQTPVPIRFDPKALLVASQDGLYLRVRRIARVMNDRS